jgi:hypothetical protein
MLINFGMDSIFVESWPDKSELVNLIADCEIGGIILDEDVEEPARYYSVTISFGWSGFPRYCIGLCCEEYGVSPGLLLDASRGIIFIGLNQRVIHFEVGSRKILGSISLDSVFHRFIRLDPLNVILVFHEIGVAALGTNGNEIWRHSADLIEDVSLSADEIRLEFMDIEPVLIDLRSGRTRIP